MRRVRNSPWSSYASRYGIPFAIAIVFLAIEASCDLAMPTVMSHIVDFGVEKRDQAVVIRLGLLMLGLTAIGACAALGRNYVSTRVSQNFGSRLREDLFAKTLSLSSADLAGIGSAGLVTRLGNDVTQVQGFVNGMMRIFVKAPLLCIGSIVMAFLLNPGLALILVLVVPAVAVIMYLSLRAGYPRFRAVQSSMDRINGVFREYLAGVRVVKAFGRFDRENERFEKANSDLGAANVTALKTIATFAPLVAFIVNAGIVAVLWFGSAGVHSGQASVGQIIAFVNYMTQVLTSLVMISHVFNTFVRARASADRIVEVFSTENTVRDPALPRSFDPEPDDSKGSAEPGGVAAPGLEFRDVSFGFPGGPDILSGVSASCARGEILGVIGPTGSGKSSLGRLVPRLFDVRSGSVRLNGIDVRDGALGDLRSRVSFVDQTTLLFSGTVGDNIRWGKKNASPEELREAARIAMADDFISKLEKGYDSVLGRGGVNLSGGQKQRVSIARALVRDPEILVLDDSTSAVDVITEAAILDALLERRSMALVLITQRVQSARRCDRVLVLDAGRVAGYGTHEELLRDCPLYREISESQLGRPEEDLDRV